jgi:hypothetical protein
VVLVVAITEQRYREVMAAGVLEVETAQRMALMEPLTLEVAVAVAAQPQELEMQVAVLAVQASLSSKSPMPIVRHSLAVLPTLYRLQAQT